MSSGFHIRYVRYHEIDFTKWDNCISNSPNGFIYGYSYYLDHMAKQWDGLVLNDYEAVMPLTWKQKWGIRYLYQPSFIQQGGIFSTEKLSSTTIQLFLKEAFRKFRFAEITFNYMNEVNPGKEWTVKMHNNFILQLGSGYKHINAHYSSYIKQRLNRLVKFSLQYKQSIDYTEAIQLYKKLYGARMSSVSDKDYLQFENLCKRLLAENRIVIRHVYNKDHKELLALMLLVKDDKRLYNIISCILPTGKKLLANYFLYNEVIREFSEQNIILDFEGSDIQGVAYFYNKFASCNQQYPFIKFNRLPIPIKLLKR